MALSQRYSSLDHLLLAAAEVKMGNTREGLKRLSLATEEPDLEEAMEELEESQSDGMDEDIMSSRSSRRGRGRRRYSSFYRDSLSGDDEEDEEEEEEEEEEEDEEDEEEDYKSSFLRRRRLGRSRRRGRSFSMRRPRRSSHALSDDDIDMDDDLDHELSMDDMDDDDMMESMDDMDDMESMGPMHRRKRGRSSRYVGSRYRTRSRNNSNRVTLSLTRPEALALRRALRR